MMPRMLLLLSALSACNGDKSTSDTSSAVTENPDCDPVAAELCGLPFPSTFYMTEEADSPTGWRVSLGPTTLPVNANDFQPSPTLWNERDGFSPVTPIMTWLPGLSLDGVVSHEDIDASLADGALTVVLDAETGERIPHFAELDMSHDDDSRRMLMIYPAAPMAAGHRHVVALRGMTDTAGAPIEAGAPFAALRDGTTSDSALLEGRRSYYDEAIFPILEADGVGRDDLILAWDFVVASQECTTGKMAWIRDDLLATIGVDGPEYTITEVEEAPAEHVGRRIHGEMTVPLYTEVDKEGTLLTRGADGMPYANGTTQVPFIVVIPESVLSGEKVGAVLQYGHGLLGSHEEVTWGGHSYLPELADRYGYVIIAVSWTGMKEKDTGAITLMLVDQIDRFAMLPERSQQGFAEQLAAMRLITGRLSEDEAMQSATGGSVVDPERRYFYGNSQGGILGGAYAALSPDIQRATFGVGGSPYALLLFRSADFSDFFLVFQTMFPDPLHIALWMGYMQALWDSGESAGYLNEMDKDVLLQVGIGDSQVTTLGAHIQARAYDAALIAPAVRPVWGLEEVEGPHVGSALVEWDYGAIEPVENIPPDEATDTHEGPRREWAAQEQLHHFFSTGEVINTCEGTCTGTLD
ncbi:MAG: hypothetical protein ACI8S6_005113 [Myxococcota bacterium]|jgi:hypothetical protein